MNRPYPPEKDQLEEDDEESGGLLEFEPDNGELWDWVNENFLNEDSPLYNPDHEHLLSFRPPEIVFLWAYCSAHTKKRRILGQCERVMINVGGWKKARQEMQLIDWYGDVPKYIITLDARACAVMSDTDFCALVEHELYHIAQELDGNGCLRWDSLGRPVLYLCSHDVEEFYGVVKRYGASPSVQKMAELANQEPTISKTNISHACGTCLKSV